MDHEIEGYVGLILELFKLVQGGRGDSDEADEVRQRMLDFSIVPEYREFLDHLYGDLHLLLGEGLYIKTTERGELMERLRGAMVRGDWPEVLELSRYALGASDSQIAFLRAVGWGQMDDRLWDIFIGYYQSISL
jgi:hypothetical protein